MARHLALVVGGGSVGQVYGWALEKAGFDVTFYLKPSHLKQARLGYTLHWLNHDRALRAPIHFKSFKIMSETQEIAQITWDVIYLAVSSSALRSGWLDNFSRAARTAKCVIALQPGIHDRKFLLQYFSEQQLAQSLISIIAFSEGQTTAFYTPPFEKNPVRPPLSIKKLKKVAFFTAILHCFVVALEDADWSLKKIQDRRRLKQLSLSLSEITKALERKLQTPAPFVLKLLGPTTLRVLIAIAPSLFPFPLEKYLKNHFNKVSDQTRLMTQDYKSLL
jgi:2-dehydropantoate 2-reductase